MQTLRSAVSDITTDLRSNNLDDNYSFRFLANKLKGNIENFLRQDATDRGILKINELWKPLNNVVLKDYYSESNNQFYDEYSNMMVSVHKIPDVYTCKYGNLIKVVNLKGSMEYVQTKPFLYKDIKNREYASKKIKYFWVEDGYLFLPDSSAEEVKIYALFKDSQEADVFNGKVGCCYKPLDSVLLVPDYIVTIAKKQVAMDLLQQKQIIPDENPNLNVLEK